MSIDDYRPTFVVEAVYDLRADDLFKETIQESAENYYNNLFQSVYPDCTLEFVYD